MKARLLAAMGAALVLGACGDDATPRFERITTPEALSAHSAEFERGIEQITDGVWIAIGYGLANSVLIEGDDGVIVIDTMETMEEGREVARAFAERTDKPLRAIVYTHNHTDHVFGAQAFVDVLGVQGVPVEIIGHADTEKLVNRIVSEYRPIITARSFRMFGTALDDAAFVNNGIGPRLGIDAESRFGFVAPTRTVAERTTLEIAGVRMEIAHAPGETDDQLYVWLPDRRVLAPGDNLYKTFPNLYTIRGTPYRSLKDWAASLDAMRALGAEHVAPSHTRPLHGADEIARVLTAYRDAIRYVYDQTVRWMNAGLTPDEIVERVQLPPHLASEPYLQPFYGTVEWSVRAVFAGNLGWFDGNPSRLRPLAPRAEAERMARLAGGRDALKGALDTAAADGDHQWVLELSDHVLRLDPDDAAARAARVAALTALGEAAANPNARHYYLMSAAELRDGLRLAPINSGSDAMIAQLPMAVVMDALATNLRAEDVLDVEQRVALRFPDTGDAWTLWLRRGVLEPVPALLDERDLLVEVDSLAWKKMLGGQVNPALAIAKDMTFVEGGRVAFARFLKHFEPVRAAPEPAPLAAVD